MSETYAISAHTRTVIEPGNPDVDRPDQYYLVSALTGDALAGPQETPWTAAEAETIWQATP